MKLGHDTVVALFSRRDDDDATVRADADGPSPRSRLIPLAIIAVLATVYTGIGAYWLVTGAPPSFLTPAGQRAVLDVPPRPGPENPQSALLKPPPGPGKPAADKSAPPAPEPSPPAVDTPPAAIAPARPPLPPVPEVAMPLVPAGPAPAPQLATLPPPKAAPPLGEAPVADLVRMTPSGPLPVIAADGRAPWRTYARPFSDASGRARVAVVVAGLGLGKAVTEAAITRLPADVTLAFSPYAKDLDMWFRRARAAGHEVLLELPLEAARFPERDSGPLALVQALPDAKLKERLEAVLMKATGYVGLLATQDSPFARSDRLKLALDDARKRGLLYVGEPANLPDDPLAQPAFAAIAVTLDGQPFRAAIDARLGQTVDAAKVRGHAVAVTQALPIAIERLAQWFGGLTDKGVVLAPVSSVATPPPVAK